jgi:hypothetical protein
MRSKGWASAPPSPASPSSARANGLTFLTATTLWENRAARGLLRQHGFRAQQSRGGEIEYELKLQELGLATVNAAPDLGAVSHAVGAVSCIAPDV